MMKKFVPNHLAIIPDGNRRWAKKKGMISFKGVEYGGSYEHLKELFEGLKDSGVKHVSVWGFSTENWKRPKKEIESVFKLIAKSIDKFRKDAFENKIRFRHFGRKDRIPRKIVELLDNLESDTKEFTDFNVQLCLDYGGRDEIVRAVNKIILEGLKNIDEESFSKYLDDSEIPDVDFIIRTSGEKRTSGLMPFQSDYAEFYFIDKYFPDLNSNDLREAIEEFERRKRNFGK